MENKTVLIVDDSRVSRIMVKNTFVSVQNNWEIVEAANGIEAISKYDEFAPDLIIMDVNMPELDGFDTAEQLVNRTDFNTPIMILSANIQSSSRERANLLGIHFFKKPITADSVCKMIDLWEKSHE